MTTLQPAGSETDHESGPSVDKSAPHRGLSTRVLVACAAAVLVSGLFAYVAVRYRSENSQSAEIRASGIPSNVSTPVADLMQLSPVPRHFAPEFTLVDQNGRTMSLSSFRGRTVVLEFMDPHCVDICPIVSQEFVDAYHDLGPAAAGAVFVAVNVNQYYTEVAEAAAFSNAQGLTAIPNWHFFTADPDTLKTVWADYAVEVSAPNPNADIVHSSLVYFIDPTGHERYLASPMVDHTSSGSAYLPRDQIGSWGQGIASVVRSLSG